MANANSNNKPVLIVVVAVVAGLLIYGILTMPDQRTTTERIGDAIHELPDGPEKAARELEKRTPGERLGDAVKDATDK